MNDIDEKYKRLLNGANVFEREKVEPLLVSFLQDHPDYAPALRLRGLMLEYEVALEQSQGVSVDSYDPRLEIMRKSYEDALQADPYYVLAAIDLGDYWNEFADYPETAIEYYDRAILLLKTGHCTEDRNGELRNAYKGKIHVLIALDKYDAAAHCREQAKVDCRGDDFVDVTIPDDDSEDLSDPLSH
jgi:tetratricopeptide (TPR) repeat protein